MGIMKAVYLKLTRAEHETLFEMKGGDAKDGGKTWENFVLSLAGLKERD